MKQISQFLLLSCALLPVLHMRAQNYYMTFGGTNNDYCYGAALDGGNVYVIGVTATFSTEVAALMLAKINSTGQLEWAKQYEAGTAMFGMTWATHIEVYNGALYFSGYTDDYAGGTSKDIVLGKADTLGNILWTERLGWDGHDRPYDFCLLDNDVYLIGQENQIANSGLNRIIVAKYSGDGTFRWMKFYGNDGLQFGYGISAVGQNLAAVGFSSGYGNGDNDGLVMLLDTSGSVKWSRLMQSTGNDNLYAVEAINDHEFALVGETDFNTVGGTDVVLVKMDTTGNVLISRKMGTASSDFARTAVIRNDHLLVSGWRNDSYGNTYLLEVDEWGQYLNAVDIGVADGTERIRAVDADNNHIAMAGYSNAASIVTSGNGGSNDALVAQIDRLNSDLCDTLHITFDTTAFDLNFLSLSIADSLTTLSSAVQPLIVNSVSFNSFQYCSYPDAVQQTPPDNTAFFYPNPVTAMLQISPEAGIDCSLRIVDALGRCCYFSSVLPEDEIDLSGFSDGLYFVMLSNHGHTITRKLIKVSGK